jgi:PhnB protein
MAANQESDYEGADLRAVRPYLIVGDGEAAIAWYREAFDAIELERHQLPSGPIAHAKLRIGETIVELGESPDAVGRAIKQLPRVGLRLYVADVDDTFSRAVAAGGTGDPPENRLPGTRSATVYDPFGLTWWLAAAIQ